MQDKSAINQHHYLDRAAWLTCKHDWWLRHSALEHWDIMHVALRHSACSIHWLVEYAIYYFYIVCGMRCRLKKDYYRKVVKL